MLVDALLGCCTSERKKKRSKWKPLTNLTCRSIKLSVNLRVPLPFMPLPRECRPIRKAKKKTSSSSAILSICFFNDEKNVSWAQIIFYDSSIIYYTNNIKIVNSTLCAMRSRFALICEPSPPKTNRMKRQRRKSLRNHNETHSWKCFVYLIFTKQEIKEDHNLLAFSWAGKQRKKLWAVAKPPL